MKPLLYLLAALAAVVASYRMVREPIPETPYQLCLQPSGNTNQRNSK